MSDVVYIGALIETSTKVDLTLIHAFQFFTPRSDTEILGIFNDLMPKAMADAVVALISEMKSVSKVTLIEYQEEMPEVASYVELLRTKLMASVVELKPQTDDLSALASMTKIHYGLAEYVDEVLDQLDDPMAVLMDSMDEGEDEDEG